MTHSVTSVTKGSGDRLSLVCEQYSLEDHELEDIPEFKLESRAIAPEAKRTKSRA